MMKQEKYKYIPIETDGRYRKLFERSIEHIIEKLKGVNHSGLKKGLTLKKKYLDSNGKIDFNRQKNLVRHGVVQVEFNEIPDWLFGMDYGYYKLDEEIITEMGYVLNDKGEYVFDGYLYDLNGYGDYVEVGIFAQHKYFIDEFIYSSSEFAATTTAPVKYTIENGKRIYLDILGGDFGAISYRPNPEREYVEPFSLLWAYPDIAFYKHMTGADLNKEYILPEEAKEYKDKKLREEKEYLNLYKKWKREIFISILEEINKRYGISKRKITLRNPADITRLPYTVVIELTPQEFVLFSEEIQQLIVDVDNKVTKELSSTENWHLMKYSDSPILEYIQCVVNGETKYYTMSYPDLKDEDISEDTALLIIHNKEHVSG